MRPRRSFRPSESWTLEDRVALSHASAEIAALAFPAHGISATFHGKYTTQVTHGVDNASSVIHLNGSDKVAGIGAVNLSGSLSNSIVFPSSGQPTTGTITLSSKSHPETVTLALTGPYANLAPTSREPIAFTFTVQSATGRLASETGDHGTAELILSGGKTSSTSPGLTSTSHGKFTMILATS